MCNDFQSEDEKTQTLRDAIRRSFPVIAHKGQITNCDSAWLPELTEENAIHDDDMFVYEALRGRTWPDIAKEFLLREPDGFVLLTHEALVAYLAAWLMCALDNIDSENIVREFVIYSFSPSRGLRPDMTPYKVAHLRALSPEQRATVRSLMVEFAEREKSLYLRRDAASAVELIDRIENPAKT